jgi:RNA polymerase sigma factor (sigma-70 family)
LENNDVISPSQLVDDHSDYLLSLAMSKINDIDLAKDFVQDTFISAITKLDTFEQRSTVRTWLTSILNRKIIDYWRKAETKYTDPVSSFFQSDTNKPHWLTEKHLGSEPSVSEKMEKEETLAELSDCLETLPAQWKGIIASKYLDEKESEQICNDFAITPSNLWVIIHRAKLLMRDCLQTKWK